VVEAEQFSEFSPTFAVHVAVAYVTETIQYEQTVFHYKLQISSENGCELTQATKNSLEQTRQQLEENEKKLERKRVPNCNKSAD